VQIAAAVRQKRMNRSRSGRGLVRNVEDSIPDETISTAKFWSSSPGLDAGLGALVSLNITAGNHVL